MVGQPLAAKLGLKSTAWNSACLFGDCNDDSMTME